MGLSECLSTLGWPVGARDSIGIQVGVGAGDSIGIQAQVGVGGVSEYTPLPSNSSCGAERWDGAV